MSLVVIGITRRKSNVSKIWGLADHHMVITASDSQLEFRASQGGAENAHLCLFPSSAELPSGF
jgi:hypothetical protein